MHFSVTSVLYYFDKTAGRADEQIGWKVPVNTWVSPEMTEDWDKGKIKTLEGLVEIIIHHVHNFEEHFDPIGILGIFSHYKLDKR